MKITWLEDGKLAAGGIPVGAEDVQSLHTQGVRAIVTLTEYPLTMQKALTPDIFAPLEIELLHSPIEDQTAPTLEQVRQIADFIEAMEQQNKPVFVHCHAGVGRTGTVLHAYYLLAGYPLTEAKDRVKRRRPTSQFFMLSDEQKRFVESLAESLDQPG